MEKRDMENGNKLAAICFLATLLAIVLLAMTGALVLVFGDYQNEVNVAKVVGALSFIAAAITGLVGVIGTFRPKGEPTATTRTGDVNLKP